MKIIPHEGFNLYQWEVGPSLFRVLPEQGARLMSWDIAVAGAKRSVIYWPEGQEDWSRIGSIRGGNPILFPFVARTYDKGQLGFWKTPDGRRLPMKQHGYARQGRFAVEEASETGFTALFEPDAACAEAYPYAYAFRVRYAFEELSMRVIFELENKDECALPWCAGHHFYFTLPWHPGSTRADYRLSISAKKAFYHTGDGALQPIKGFEVETGFDEAALLDRIHTRLKESRVRFGPRSTEEDIIIEVGEQPVPSAWNALVCWTENEASPFYCVEPWMGPPNSPEHKKGLHFVDPGETGQFVTTVSLA